MSGKSSFLLLEETDDMDIIMSQINTSDLEFDENVILVGKSVNGTESSFATAETDDMDEIMSQIDTEAMRPDENSMDQISQIDAEQLQQEIDDTDVPREIIEEYDMAVSEINEEIINQMQHEVDEEHEIPPELLDEFHQAMDQIVPTKSGNRYLQAYDVFRKWQADHRTNSFNEKIVLAYFGVAADKYKPPTLWSMYSMLKKTLLIKHNVDLVKHCRLRAFLKMKSDGYQPKKSNVFDAEQLRKFFEDAPNDVYLGMKVVLIFGLCSGSRGCELTNLTLDNVKDDGKEVVVKIPETKTKEPKLYVVGNEFAKIIRRYLDMRPKAVNTTRLFLQWRKGKCVSQVMGKHSIAKIPKNVARFLNLPEPDSYTGHSYRRTTTTVAADAGFSVTELKRFMGWKSDRVCEGYIQDSVAYKRNLTKRLCDVILPSTSVENTTYSDIATSSSFTTVVPSTIAAVLPSTIPAVLPSTIPAVLSSTIPTVVPSTIPAIMPSTIPTVVQSTISGAGPTTDPVSENEQHKTSSPISIKFESSSGLTLSGGGKSLIVSGAGGSQDTQNKEQNVVFHFGGDNNTFTIINMK